MLEANASEILARIKDSDRVLDIGGWYIPFTRADWVVDLMPYATRGQAGHDGPLPERFDERTWVQMDVCSSQPLPFEDNFFDFVICSHTLEDIRDPVRVCSEINRVGKAGYIETPSSQVELTFGIESKQYAGYYHHRWLVEMGAARITFMHKPHFVHGSWRYHLPKRASRSLTSAQRVTWMFWNDNFHFEEAVEIEKSEVERRVQGKVRDYGVYPGWRYGLVPIEDFLARGRNKLGRATRSLLAWRRPAASGRAPSRR